MVMGEGKFLMRPRWQALVVLSNRVCHERVSLRSKRRDASGLLAGTCVRACTHTNTQFLRERNLINKNNTLHFRHSRNRGHVIITR